MKIKDKKEYSISVFVNKLSSKIFSRVFYYRKRIIITRREERVALVPNKDFNLLQKLDEHPNAEELKEIILAGTNLPTGGVRRESPGVRVAKDIGTSGKIIEKKGTMGPKKGVPGGVIIKPRGKE